MSQSIAAGITVVGRSSTVDMERVEEAVLKPLVNPAGRRFMAFTWLLAAVFATGLAAWAWQIYHGLGVTGLGVPIFWGTYIINFVWFIGISHAGTLISAILRITDAAWRRPFTRIAETITIASLPFAVTCVIVDLGRPDRLLNVLLYPHMTSPLLWDVCCITAYFITSCLYFYIALIPDFATCRDRLTGKVSGWREKLYRWGAFGWKGTEAEVRVHRGFMTVLSVVLLALVVSVHTNVGFVFGMTSKPGWHTAVIGPYFVIGAAFQGLGALSFFIVFVRRAFHLEWLIPDEGLQQLRKFFLALTCFWGYFTGAELLTTFYGQHTAEMAVFNAKWFGQYSISFWAMIAGCFFIPFYLLATGRKNIERNLLWAGFIGNVGMWLERYTIIVPSGSRPFLPWGIGHYSLSMVEWSIFAAWVSGFFLVFLLFTRILPMLTIWEIEEG